MTRIDFRRQVLPFAAGLALAAGMIGMVAPKAPAGNPPAINWFSSDYNYFQDFDGTTTGSNNNGDSVPWINSDNGSATINGWYADYSAANDNIVLTSSAGANGAGTLLALGNDSTDERSLGAEPDDSSADIAWGVRFNNQTGHVITALRISFTGEQWAESTDGSHTTSFYYRVGGSTFELAADQSDWTAANDGDVSYNQGNSNGTFSPPNTDPVGFLLNGLWIENEEDFWFGWHDPNDVGLDHQVGIEDFEIQIVSVLVEDFDNFAEGLEITNTANNANPDSFWYENSGANFPVVVDGEVQLGNGNTVNGTARRNLTGGFGNYGDGGAEEDMYAGLVFRFEDVPEANAPVAGFMDGPFRVGTLWAVNNNGALRLGVSLNNSSNGPSVIFNQNLSANENYSVVFGTEFNGCATESRLWLNPANFNGNNVNTNTGNDNFDSGNVYDFRLEQSGDNTARFFIDDLTVATDFDVANPPLADFSAANDAATTAAPGSTVVVAEFEVDAGAHVSSTLREVTLTATGDLDDANDVDSVELWLDRDGSGDFDETLDAPVLDSDDFSADDGSVTLSLDATIAADDSATFFVVYDLASDATTDVDFSVDVSGAELFGRAAGLPVSGRTISVEPGTLTFSVSAGNSGFGKTDGSQTADILAVTVSADGNSATISSIDLAYAAASNVSGIDIVHDGTTIASASAIAAGTTETLNFSPDVTVADGADESFVVRVTITGEGAELRASITGAGVSAGVTVSGLPSGEGVITIDNGGSAFGLLLIVPLLGLIALVVIRRR